MKQNITIKSLIIAAAFGLSSVAQAADAAPANGLLGQTYGGLGYSFTNLEGTAVGIDNFTFEYNQPLNTGLDAIFNYTYSQSGVMAGNRAIGQDFGAGLRAFSSAAWGKSYIEAGVGYAKSKIAGWKEGSYTWQVAVGAEFQVCASCTVTPYVKYSDAPDLGGSDGTFDYGVKSNYWVTKQLAVVAGISRDDDKNMDYSLGLNVRF